MRAREAVFQHRQMPPADRGAMAPLLRELLGGVGRDVLIEAPFHCSYGFNTFLAEEVFINAGCTILDSGRVEIGARSMLGPNVQIFCADHHRDARLRGQGIEIAQPVTLGADVWIGGGATLLPGVTIGAGAIVGAAAVVTRDVAPGAVVIGNPARPVARPG